MIFIFSVAQNVTAGFALRISAQIQNLAALGENRVPMGRNAKLFLQTMELNLFVAGNGACCIS
jgi:hypothetical protein